MDFNKIKEVVNDPVTLDTELKKLFEKMDKGKKGYVPFDLIHHQLEEEAKKLGHEIHCENHKPGELEKGEKLADPEGKGRVNYEGFKRLVLAAIQHHKEEHHH